MRENGNDIQPKEDPWDFLASKLRNHPMAWEPRDFDTSLDSTASAASYVIDLDDRGVVEVEQALSFFKGCGLYGDEVSRESFPLPTLEAKLDAACRDIHDGRGFVVLRGLDPQRYSKEDNINIYLGVAAYIGDIRGIQNKKGDMLGKFFIRFIPSPVPGHLDLLEHITDSPDWSSVKPEMRIGIHTNQSLAWHTDTSTDILALYVLGVGTAGGDTLIASSWTICRELATFSPEVLEVLMSDCWRVQLSKTSNKHVLGPILQAHNGKIFLNIDVDLIGDALEPLQRQALDTVFALASKHSLRLSKKPGDMIFINNHSLLHARDKYIDPDVVQGHRRHLVRMWLRNSRLGWDIPASIRPHWENVFGPRGDGYPTFILDRTRRSRACGLIERQCSVTPARHYLAPLYATPSSSAAFMDYCGEAKETQHDPEDR
ncbi:hypothetical protein QBC47DRAFT_443599 [Echria macrotheca]|uniref:TauD/TfdA-like domain-containing protein n=1 Tax=Echria macrotheca TaxID=438768 RepID=A0AAJ0BFI8_9PEZI|nr:hypothetical protein QBC47DRAFT_443599 [Echria macrotheca]